MKTLRRYVLYRYAMILLTGIQAYESTERSSRNTSSWRSITGVAVFIGATMCALMGFSECKTRSLIIFMSTVNARYTLPRPRAPFTALILGQYLNLSSTIFCLYI